MSQAAVGDAVELSFRPEAAFVVTVGEKEDA